MYGNDNSFSEGYIVGRDSSGNNSNNGWNDGFGGSAWWIIILLIFGWGGFGNGGFGGGGYGNRGGFTTDASGGVAPNYVLASDFANIERKIDGVNSGLCDGFYAVNSSFGNLNNTLAQNFASVQNTLTQGFAGLNTVNVQQGYENRMATQGVASQLAQCCCDIRESIAGVNYNNAMANNALQSQLAQCCCDNRAAIADTNYNIATQANMLDRRMADTNYNIATQTNALSRQIADSSCATDRQIERSFADLGYNMAAQNCNTLQAIDRVGDRIIDHLNAEKTERLRDENQALRLAASQQAQNSYLISQLGPKCPQPAYVVQPSQPVTFPTNCCGGTNYASSGCGCGSF